MPISSGFTAVIIIYPIISNREPPIRGLRIKQISCTFLIDLDLPKWSCQHSGSRGQWRSRKLRSRPHKRSTSGTCQWTDRVCQWGLGHHRARRCPRESLPGGRHSSRALRRSSKSRLQSSHRSKPRWMSSPYTKHEGKSQGIIIRCVCCEVGKGWAFNAECSISLTAFS